MAWSGVYAVDPGKTTGLAWGVYPERGSVQSILKRGKKAGHEQLTVEAAREEVPNAWNDEHAVACAIVNRWWTFALVCWEEDVVPRLIVEDFILRPGRTSAKREGLYPARIAASMEGFLFCRLGALYMDVLAGRITSVSADKLQPWLWAPKYQGAGLAKGYATDARMKRWGMWWPGEEHARDAGRHLARWLASQDASI